MGVNAIMAMDYHIEDILLEGEFDSYRIRDETSIGKALSRLSKINIFVGANNCGKSRFLRLLAAMGGITFIPHWNIDRWKPFNDLEQQRAKLIQELRRIANMFALPRANDIATDIEKPRSVRLSVERAPTTLLGDWRRLLNLADNLGTTTTIHPSTDGGESNMAMQLAYLRGLVNTLRNMSLGSIFYSVLTPNALSVYSANLS
jgi:hypothetical protein